MRVLAVDIGIKNLAWCCGSKDASGSKDAALTIHGWENENLVTGSSEQETCASCTKKPSFTFQNRSYCVKHCTPLRDLDGSLLRTIPPMAKLKELAKHAGAQPAHLKTKDAALTFLQTKVAIPVKLTKVKSVGLEAIHDGLRAVVQRNAELFSSCKVILLENQPAFKNPMMKSVQMMLFATLRDLLEGPPEIRLVHASKKSTGATKGNEGYAERKQMTETKVQQGIADATILVEKGKDWFSKQAKKSDLADCLIMVQDYVNAAKGET